MRSVSRYQMFEENNKGQEEKVNNRNETDKTD